MGGIFGNKGKMGLIFSVIQGLAEAGDGAVTDGVYAQKLDGNIPVGSGLGDQSYPENGWRDGLNKGLRLEQVYPVWVLGETNQRIGCENTVADVKMVFLFKIGWINPTPKIDGETASIKG